MIFTHRITLTGEAIQLPSVKPKDGEVTLVTPAGNSGSMYLASNPAECGSPSDRFELAKSKEFAFKISDLSLLFVNGTSGDYLDVLCEVEGGG